MEGIDLFKEKLLSAEAVVIGAGAGMSTAAGLDYSGKRFYDNFKDYALKYGFNDMYSGGFYPYDSLEKFWAYWAKYILINRYDTPPLDTYEKLYDLVKEKNYFVLTTNVDHCFQKTGFDKKRLFYTQGDYGLFQCSAPCHDKTYDNENLVREMVNKTRNLEIPSDLIPLCPVCGRPMTVNLRSDDKFVEDEGWHKAAENYEKFITENINGKILFLELGVGFNTPGIIKFPFLRMTFNHENAFYVAINPDKAYIPDELSKKVLSFDCDINEFLAAL